MKDLTPNQETMTSKALHKVVFEATGKYEKLSDFHHKVRQVIEIVDDGILPSSIRDERGYVSYYNLTEVESNMIMASIDLKHLKLISEIFVKVKNNFTPEDPRMFALKISAVAVETAKAFGFKGNEALLSADAATQALTGYSPLKLMGKTLESPHKQLKITPTEIGKELGGLSAQKVNKILEQQGYQVKIGKKWESTEKGEEHSVMEDTRKQHSDGTPIQQLKWLSTIVELLR